jgi:hypothetical protein
MLEQSRFVHILLAGSLITNVLGGLVIWHNSKTIEVQSQFNREMRLTLAQLREQQAKNVARLHELEGKTEAMPAKRR